MKQDYISDNLRLVKQVKLNPVLLDENKYCIKML